jgi:UMF1 family MFS transporter
MDRKKVYSWAIYDWANSAFATTVMAGFFPVFFKQYWSQGTDPTLTTARLGTAITLGSLLIAFISPFLGALADTRGHKKLFCFITMLIGAGATATLGFVPEGQWLWAVLVYGIAMMGFNSTGVFYDSLLPSVARGKDIHFASSLGYSLGYLGGGVLFVFNVLMYLKPHLFGLSSAVEGVKYSFFSVGIWWICFSIPLFRNVPEPQVGHDSQMSLWTATGRSVQSLWKTGQKIYEHKNLFYFLLAYWIYIDGVFTVMTMAVDFGMSIGFQASDLIAALLIVQFVGFPFALLFSQLAQKFGSRGPILVCLGVYAATVVFATQMTQPWHFYMLACIIGMVQGGVQALSRSLFTRMIPAKASGEYFGLFNLVGKFASIFGPTLVGWGAYLSGEPRMGMLGLLVLFGLGGTLLFLVEEPNDAA